MRVQINHDDHIRTPHERATQIEATIRAALGRYAAMITDLEVHLSDDNGLRFRPGDKRCLIEARIARRTAIAVSDNADSVERAVYGASGKLERSIAAIVDRSRNH